MPFIPYLNCRIGVLPQLKRKDQQTKHAESDNCAIEYNNCVINLDKGALKKSRGGKAPLRDLQI